MPYRSDRPLSLPEWLVLCLACEQPTYGFAIAELLSHDGSLGQIWQVAKPTIYRAMQRLERLGLVQKISTLTVVQPAHWSRRPAPAARRLQRGCTSPSRTAGTSGQS